MDTSTTSKRVAILDADSVVWTTAYLARNEALEGDMLSQLDFFLTSMFNKVNATHYIGFLGGSSSATFRKQLFPSYKAKRSLRPVWLEQWERVIKTHLIEKWKFEVCLDIEADDGCSIAAAQCRKENTDYVVCAIDKDLKQIPGEHYNFNTGEAVKISQVEADFLLFSQSLSGDSTDNIGGLAGIGPAKAKKILQPEESLNNRGSHTANVIGAYIDRLGVREGLAKFAETYLLVRLKEDGNIIYEWQRAPDALLDARDQDWRDSLLENKSGEA